MFNSRDAFQILLKKHVLNNQSGPSPVLDTREIGKQDKDSGLPGIQIRC